MAPQSARSLNWRLALVFYSHAGVLNSHARVVYSQRRRPLLARARFLLARRRLLLARRRLLLVRARRLLKVSIPQTAQYVSDCTFPIPNLSKMRYIEVYHVVLRKALLCLY